MNSKENINSLDCVNHSLHGLDCKPHMKGFIFNNMQEVWKNVNGFEGLYQISNFGKVKSLPRKWQPKEIILKPGKDKNGYFKVILHKNKIRYNKQVHILVFDNFGKSKRNGHKLQVDHFDENKQNNYIENLQLLTNRQNISKGYKNKKTSSNYTGVSWCKTHCKWVSKITYNNKSYCLGYFDIEYEAHLAYKHRLNELLTNKII